MWHNIRMKLFRNTLTSIHYTIADLEKRGGNVESPGRNPESTINALWDLKNEREFSEIITALQTKIEALNTWLDAKKWTDWIKQLIQEKILSVAQIPQNAKQEFLSDLRWLVMQLSEVVDIDKLKLEQKRYKTASMWISSVEESSLAGILENTLKSTFEKYIHGASTWLHAAFVEQKKVGDQIYNEKVYTDFMGGLNQTDAKYPWINIGWYIAGRISREYLGDRFLTRDIGITLLKKFEDRLPIETYHSLLGILSRNTLTEAIEMKKSWKPVGSPWYHLNLAINGSTLVNLNGKQSDFLDILVEYTTLGKDFVQRQSEIGVARERAIGQSVVGNVRKWLWLPVLKNEFDFLETIDTTTLTMGKIMQLATQFASIVIPWIGWSQDLISAITSIDNQDWALLPWYERALYAFFWTLDITVAWSFIAKLRKARQLSRLTKALQKISSQIPGVVQKHIEWWGKFTKDTAEAVIKLGKLLWKEVGEKLHEMLTGYMQRNGMILNFTEKGRKIDNGWLFFRQWLYVEVKINREGGGFEKAFWTIYWRDEHDQSYWKINMHTWKYAGKMIWKPQEDISWLPEIGKTMNIRRSDWRITPVVIKSYDWDSVIFEENWRRFSRPIDDIVINKWREQEKVIPIIPPNIEKTRMDTFSEVMRKKWWGLSQEARLLITELYPEKNGIWNISKQWNVWNCYFLAGLDAMKYSEDIYDMLTKIIKKVPKGWEVNFQWLNPPHNKTLITQKDLEWLATVDEYWRTVKLISDSSLGDRILERAYWRLRKYRAEVNNGVNVTRAGINSVPHAGSNMTRTTYVFDRHASQQVLAHHWGNPDIVFQDLFWYSAAYHDLNNLRDANSFRSLLWTHQKKWIYAVSTISSTNGDKDTFVLHTQTGTHTLYYQHAYSAFYDDITDMITIINPHNTQEQRYTLPLSEFIKNENFSIFYTGAP